MRGFSLSLAHAGYTVVAWDFDGHGANPNPFPEDLESNALVENAVSALDSARVFGLPIDERVAILGHSMGSGAALSYGVDHPETAATIAVSPVTRSVTNHLPQNLLLMAGSLEPRFVSNAEQLLAEAGGSGGDPSQGSARALSVISGVEHISILFDPDSHTEARAWLDKTFGPQPGAVDYTDRRILWYGLGILGALLLGWAITPFINEIPPAPPFPPSFLRGLLSPFGGALAATLIMAVINKFSGTLDNPLGLVVGGYVLVWFGLAGLVGLLPLGFRLSPISWRLLLGGVVASIVLWFGVGALSQWVWVPWLLNLKRLSLVPVGMLLTLPWFFTIGEILRGEGFRRRFFGWIAHSIILAGGFFGSVQLIPGLGVLILVLPLLPVILGLVELATARLYGSWPYAISGSLFLSWTLFAVFPLT
jgi:pimeloyl-ACP methyl ester carboxylesterase